ncbi:MAG: hypothetical protein DWQ36_13450 [Acidobacteria bacterium]|nr:MAG: hypothetical protein DWQ30_05760 [Acidobacteriota bacterium]REK06913.1 MAG: hypothetical protein DWQ36_13450 [Acidobacteriota bacterium]
MRLPAHRAPDRERAASADRLAAPLARAFLIASAAAALAGALAAQEVRLPLDHYHRLLERARLDPLPAVDAASPVALESAELRIELGPRTALVTSELSVAVQGDGWQSVDLAGSGQFLRLEVADAASGGDDSGAEVRLREDGGALLVRGRGRHRIRLDSAHDLGIGGEATRPRRELQLALPLAGHVRGTLRGHGSDEVELTQGGALLTPQAQAADELRWVGAPGETLHLTALGQGLLPRGGDQPLRFSATVRADLQLTRLRRELAVGVELNVLQGALGELEIELPEGYRIQRLDERPLAGWDVEDGRLQAQLLQATTSGFRLDFVMEAAATSDLVAAPRIEVLGALRSRHLVRAAVEGDGILSLHDTGSGVELDDAGSTRAKSADGADQTRQRSPLYQVLDPQRPPQWRLVWPDQTEVLALRVDSLVVDAVVGAAGEAIYNLQLVVASRGPSEVRLHLASGFRLVRAERDGRRLRAGLGRDGALVLPLSSGAGQQSFSVVGVLPVERIGQLAGGAPLRLPVPRASAPITEVFVRAQLPSDWSYRLIEPEREVPSHVVENRSGGALLELPPGFVALHASWSALSSDPGDLGIEVVEQRQREEWF